MAAGFRSWFIPDLPIFNGKDHFDHWQLKMKTFFISQGLWYNVIQNGILTSTDDHEEQRKDAHALYCIQQALAPTIFPKIIHALSAKDAWDILDANYKFHHYFLADEDLHAFEIPEVFEEEISLPIGCIKMIPKQIRDLNPAAYTPQLISIGPLHHGRPHLGGMEKYKLKYAESFLERTNKPKALFVHFIQKHVLNIRLFYFEECELDSRAYIEMILLDSFFILEFIMYYCEYSLHRLLSIMDLTHDKESLWLDPDLIKKIMLDLLMIENQLPYLLLSKLFDLSGEDGDLRSRCMHFFDRVGLEISGVTDNYNEHFHLLHFTGRIITTELSTPRQYSTYNPNLYYAAQKLSESRVKFQSIKSPGLNKIRFEKSSLHLPKLKIADNTTEILFRNIIGMEQSGVEDDAFICSYVWFLHLLMKSDDDVAVLVNANVIINGLDNNQAVVELFNDLCRNIIPLHNFHFSKICKDLEDYCSSWEGWLNNCARTLKDVYFSNLWIGTGTIAAIILLVLTLIQTIASILQVVYR
ncbi:hypothetical protein ACFE04_021721 [Oxalis oulophora]